MSAISFSTTVRKETDDKGDWAVITLRGKYKYPGSLELSAMLTFTHGSHIRASEQPQDHPGSMTNIMSGYCIFSHITPMHYR